MFGISSTELLIILLVGVVVVGPEKMPAIMRTLARMLAEFRRVKTDFHRFMNFELARLEEKNPPKPPLNPGAEPAPPAELPASTGESGLAPDAAETDAQARKLPEARSKEGTPLKGELSNPEGNCDER
jgi:sec-independent protein translocase protein TatB